MSVALLKTYIRMLRERAEHVEKGSRDDDESLLCDDEDEGNIQQEFSAAGAVAGYTGPLGVDPDKLGRKKNSKKD